MILYHGGTYSKLINMVENGFHIPEDKQGDNFGITYGPGLYLALNESDARFYSEGGQILKIIIERELKLLRINPVRPTDKKQENKLKRKKKDGIENNYDGFIVTNPDGETEIIIWDPTFISKGCLQLF